MYAMRMTVTNSYRVNPVFLISSFKWRRKIPSSTTMSPVSWQCHSTWDRASARCSLTSVSTVITVLSFIALFKKPLSQPVNHTNISIYIILSVKCRTPAQIRVYNVNTDKTVKLKPFVPFSHYTKFLYCPFLCTSDFYFASTASWDIKMHCKS